MSPCLHLAKLNPARTLSTPAARYASLLAAVSLKHTAQAVHDLCDAQRFQLPTDGLKLCKLGCTVVLLAASLANVLAACSQVLQRCQTCALRKDHSIQLGT